MKVVNVEQFLAMNCTPVNDFQRKYGGMGELQNAYMDGIRDCENMLQQSAGELVTCDQCVYAFQLHRSLFCRQMRRSSEPVVYMMVERDNYCAWGRMRQHGTDK